MNNYRIYFDESQKADVIALLRKHNDIIIDNVVDNSVGITIERDDADAYYSTVMDEINTQCFLQRVETGRPDLV
jgi:hypothetical protein